MDEIDEERARKLREDFGRRRWLVSWHLEGRAAWLARVSGPGHDDTLEARGKTRAEAIERAADALRKAIDTPA